MASPLTERYSPPNRIESLFSPLYYAAQAFGPYGLAVDTFAKEHGIEARRHFDTENPTITIGNVQILYVPGHQRFHLISQAQYVTHHHASWQQGDPIDIVSLLTQAAKSVRKRSQSQAK